MVVSDLSVLWADADIYQSDLPYVKVGQALELSLPYWPGKIFEGKVIFVSPALDPETRTLRARLEVPNREALFKPGMYGEARLYYDLGEKLSIPAAAVMFGGQHTYAFRDLGDGHIVPAEIEIGMRSDGAYELRKGLNEGDKVVASANFLVDSESNLKAALEALGGSSAGDSSKSRVPVDDIATEQLEKLLPVYFDIQTALAADDLAKAKLAAGSLKQAKPKGMERISGASDISQARVEFATLSLGVRKSMEKGEQRKDPPLYWFFCPMAFDNQGAEWLQTGDTARNPYFGASMLECGEVKGRIPGKKGSAASGEGSTH